MNISMRFDIITIFPKIFNSYFNESIIKRAQKSGKIEIRIHNLRNWAVDKRKTVALRQAQGNREPRRTIDDRPYGGGPGMVLKIEPIFKAVQSLKSKINPSINSHSSLSLRAHPSESKTGLILSKAEGLKIKTILFSTRGKKFDQKMARRLSKYDQLILICGHYEGVDERVAKYIADEEISIGDFILTGGELPAMILVDAVVRHLPGVLNKEESLEEKKGSYLVYTRPEVFKCNPPHQMGTGAKGAKKGQSSLWCGGKGKKLRVPKVLLSGDHKKIEEWRRKTGRLKVE